jgi:hypothetical protein
VRAPTRQVFCAVQLHNTVLPHGACDTLAPAQDAHGAADTGLAVFVLALGVYMHALGCASTTQRLTCAGGGWVCASKSQPMPGI